MSSQQNFERLEAVKLAFQNWRKTRTKKGPTPSDLVDQAFELIDIYPVSVVASHLGLNHSFFKKYATTTSSIDHTEFVSLDLKIQPTQITASEAEENSSIEVKATLTSGTLIEASLRFDQFLQLIDNQARRISG